MLSNIFAVMRRELGSLYSQPIAYIYSITMIGFVGLFFGAQFASLAAQGNIPADMNLIFGIMNFLALFLTPILTMRLLSEEQRSGTIELLMTLPVRDSEVVIGKYLAALIAYLTPVALSFIYLIIIVAFGNPDMGVVWSSYLGMLLWGSAIIAVGTLASALTESQMSAWLIAVGLLLFLYLSGVILQSGIVTGSAATVISELSYRTHFDNFLRGLITAKDVMYYVVVTVVTLFAATRALESRRWR